MKCPHCQQEIQGWRTITAVMPEETRDVVDEAMKELRREGFEFNSSRRLAMGELFEVLAANYLAGNGS